MANDDRYIEPGTNWEFTMAKDPSTDGEGPDVGNPTGRVGCLGSLMDYMVLGMMRMSVVVLAIAAGVLCLGILAFFLMAIFLPFMS